jgi:microsomal dipeptidase-like Zn-dependent dipeptidase
MEPSKARRDTRRRLLQGAAGKVYDLTEALIRRSCGDADIEAVLGGNFGRLLVSV